VPPSADVASHAVAERVLLGRVVVVGVVIEHADGAVGVDCDGR
jgi:hypothetical protein